MKKLILISALLIAMLIAYGCEREDNLDQNNNLISNTDPINQSSQARIKITAFDAPAPEGIEQVLLNIIEVSIHSEENGWEILSDVDTTIDFLELVNGVTVVLADDSIPVGTYDQIRLLLADNNWLVIDSTDHALTVPSGLTSGLKLHYEDTLEAGEFVELYVDFDLSKSIVTGHDKYLLHPSFNIFQKDISATLSGMVTDTLGAPLENIMIRADGEIYTTSTMTDSMGYYMFTIPGGVYDIMAELDSTMTADTAYIDVPVNPGDALTGYDFIITETASE